MLMMCREVNIYRKYAPPPQHWALVPDSQPVRGVARWTPGRGVPPTSPPPPLAAPLATPPASPPAAPEHECAHQYKYRLLQCEPEVSNLHLDIYAAPEHECAHQYKYRLLKCEPEVSNLHLDICAQLRGFRV
jgi:hypothetical protein